MLSVRFHDFGDPSTVLRAEDIAPPEPRPDEILVRLRARSINPSDLLSIRGRYGILPSLPATPGMEGMGEVAAYGHEVRGYHVGQRVIPDGVHGTWQEMTVATASQLIAVPESVSDLSAAQLVVNPLSAWIMVVEQLSLEPGEWLVQTAAASTLGRIVLQIARLVGFRTINIVRNREQAEDLMGLGADEVIVGDDADIAGRIRAIARGEPVSKAIDAVGGEAGSAVVRALAPGGRMIVYGALSMKPLAIDTSGLIYSGVTIRGFWLNQWRRVTPLEARRPVIAGVVEAMASGAIVPPVEAEYPLADFAPAVLHARKSGRRGKVLLTG